MPSPLQFERIKAVPLSTQIFPSSFLISYHLLSLRFVSSLRHFDRDVTIRRGRPIVRGRPEGYQEVERRPKTRRRSFGAQFSVRVDSSVWFSHFRSPGPFILCVVYASQTEKNRYRRWWRYDNAVTTKGASSCRGDMRISARRRLGSSRASQQTPT